MKKENLIEILRINYNGIVCPFIDNPDLDIRELQHTGWLLIVTNKLDARNDNIELYIKKNGDRFIISDDCYILNELFYIDSHKDSQKQNKIDRIIQKYDLKINEYDNYSHHICSDHKDISKSIDDFVNAILEIEEVINNE